MATATVPPAAAEPRPHRFTVADYYRMAEAGILSEDDRVELLGAVDCCNRAFSAGVGGRAVVRVRNPLALGEYDEPEPDVALVRPPGRRSATAHPGAAEVLRLVEVAETSLAYDQRTNAAVYAAAGIREVWVVNLPDRVLEVYRDPGPPGYRDRQTNGLDARVAPLAFPELVLAVADLPPLGGLERERERPRGTEPER